MIIISSNTNQPRERISSASAMSRTPRYNVGPVEHIQNKLSKYYTIKPLSMIPTISIRQYSNRAYILKQYKTIPRILLNLYDQI